MRIPAGIFQIAKEILRHLLRRPVVGVSAVAQTHDGRVLLIRRSDTGEWALPGGTLEWGEELRPAITRELFEEAGVTQVDLGPLLGVYSALHRDPRFHAVTVVVGATIDEPERDPQNPAEILEVGLFPRDRLPPGLSQANGEMLENALAQKTVWE